VRQVFGDTQYWVALTDPRDTWRTDALAASSSLGSVRIVTSEPVLIEFLNHFSAYGSYWRDQALLQAETILASEQVEVLPYHPSTLQHGMDFYAARRDKQYSLTDCISMSEMREREIFEVLTNDLHFAQEGFVLLLR
jgi:predicted nucleic acid-binding protein